MKPSDADDRLRSSAAPGKPVERPLSAAAQRALAEAAARRAERDRAAADRTREHQDRERQDREEGLDPTRYGDWEVKGIASDF